MKNKIIPLLLAASLAACSNDSKKDATLNADSIANSPSTLSDAKTPGTVDKSTALTAAKKLPGVWIVKGSETGNANFLLTDSTIYYPETDGKYAYKLIKDTLEVKYDDYTQHLAFKFKGNDTLILTGEDGPNMFYRVKK